MKSSLALVTVLFFAAGAHAQNSPMRTTTSTPITSGGAGLSSGAPFSSGYSSGSAFSMGFGSGGAGTPVVWEPPREFMVLYARNDGPFVPSTFMKYDEALALGRLQMAQLEVAAAAAFAEHVGEMPTTNVPAFMKYDDALLLGKRQRAQQEADALVSFAEAVHKVQAEKVPTFRLRSRVVQDDSGRLHICNLNGNDCRSI